MLFKIICYILGTTALIKGITGILAHDKLYEWAEKHYAKNEMSFTVKILFTYAFVILALTWYATIYQYVEYGWIITVFISLMSIKSVSLTLKWDKASKKFVKLIRNSGKTLWVLDVTVILLSIIFLGLGYYLY